MRRKQAHLRLRVLVDDQPVGSRTQVSRVTRDLEVWETVVPELGVELRSAYTGRRGGDARVEHLGLTPALVDIETVELDGARATLLRDTEQRSGSHLLRFQELMQRSGHRARVTQIGQLPRRLGVGGWLTRTRRGAR